MFWAKKLFLFPRLLLKEKELLTSRFFKSILYVQNAVISRALSGSPYYGIFLCYVGWCLFITQTKYEVSNTKQESSKITMGENRLIDVNAFI